MIYFLIHFICSKTNLHVFAAELVQSASLCHNHHCSKLHPSPESNPWFHPHHDGIAALHELIQVGTDAPKNYVTVIALYQKLDKNSFTLCRYGNCKILLDVWGPSQKQTCAIC